MTKEQKAAFDNLAQASGASQPAVVWNGSAVSGKAELQALQQEPRDARAQGGDAGTGSRRRPAARNAEEDRRLSRRIDAA